MVILIGNQKGGAGKSTLALLLANYLTQVRGRKVTVLDMDYQQSLASKAEKAKVLENEAPYEIVPAGLEAFPSLHRALGSAKGEMVVIDLPGKMDDNGLVPIFQSADAVLCPFSYDEFSVDSTVLFAMVMRRINPRAPLVFVPNRVKTTVRYETREEVERALANFGVVTPPFADRVDFQRIATGATPAILYPVALPVLDLVYDQYLDRGDSP